MKNLGTKGKVTTWQMEDSDIPKIPMPISPDILKYQPERLNPEAHKKCAQCRIDDFHKENDPEMYESQVMDRLENPSKNWCTCSMRCDSLNSKET